MAAHRSLVACGSRVTGLRTWISLAAAFDWLRIDVGFFFGSICDSELMLVEEQAADIPDLWGRVRARKAGARHRARLLRRPEAALILA